MGGSSSKQMGHNIGKDQYEDELSSLVGGCDQLLYKEVSSPSLKEFKQRLGNHSTLGMLYRKFNSCHGEWEEQGYTIFILHQEPRMKWEPYQLLFDHLGLKFPSMGLPWWLRQ